MSTEFQKDLYKKSGSLLTVWDICIGIGLITLGSGAYIHFKDKKGSASELPIEDAGNKKIEQQEKKSFKEYEDRHKKQLVDRKRKQTEEKLHKSSVKKDKDALSKLGL